jgi:hypothetical protein
VAGVVDRDFRRRLAVAGPTLVRPRRMRRAQAASGRCREVAAVGRHHYAVAGDKIEGLASRQIDPRLRLVVAGGLGSQDGIPGKTIAARHVDHQGDIAVRDRRNEYALLEPSKSRRRVRPSIEPMPGKIDIAQRRLSEIGQAEARHDALTGMSQSCPLSHRDVA